MIPFLTAIFIVLTILVVQIIFKQKINWVTILMVFFLLLGILFFFSSEKGNAAQNPHAQNEIHLFYKLKQLKPYERQYYEEKIKFHRENATRTYNEANERCRFLPKIDDRKKAEYCFTTAISMIAPATPMSKVVVGLISLLGQYGIDCLKEWEYIDNKLYWSHYHYDMMEFYEDLLYYEG